MSGTTTSIVHTERLGWNRPILPLLRPCSATLAEPECADATCMVDWFTSTNELHERFYAPYAPELDDSDVPTEPSMAHHRS